MDDKIFGSTYNNCNNVYSYNKTIELIFSIDIMSRDINDI
jgi:hypothetical protein